MEFYLLLPVTRMSCSNALLCVFYRKTIIIIAMSRNSHLKCILDKHNSDINDNMSNWIIKSSAHNSPKPNNYFHLLLTKQWIKRWFYSGKVKIWLTCQIFEAYFWKLLSMVLQLMNGVSGPYNQFNTRGTWSMVENSLQVEPQNSSYGGFRQKHIFSPWSYTYRNHSHDHSKKKQCWNIFVCLSFCWNTKQSLRH